MTGYTIDRPTHNIVVNGADEHDEVFHVMAYGAFNVTRYAQMLASKPQRFQRVTIPFSTALLTYVRSFITTDQEHIDSISEQRRDEPVFAIQLAKVQPPSLSSLMVITASSDDIKMASRELKRG